MIKEFKEFVLRGNAVELAVGVMVGAAFGSVVSALVTDLMTPMISAIVKLPDFSSLTFTINGSVFAYGHFLNALLSFLLVSVTVFLFIVRPMALLVARAKKETVAAEPSTKKCAECLSAIPVAATRCAFCGQAVQKQP